MLLSKLWREALGSFADDGDLIEDGGELFFVGFQGGFADAVGVAEGTVGGVGDVNKGFLVARHRWFGRFPGCFGGGASCRCVEGRV